MYTPSTKCAVKAAVREFCGICATPKAVRKNRNEHKHTPIYMKCVAAHRIPAERLKPS